MRALACSISDNALCGVDKYGRGTYTAEGIIQISDALKVNATLTSLKCAARLYLPDLQSVSSR